MLPNCPDCQSADVGTLSRDDDKYLICNVCGFGRGREWLNPMAGSDESGDPYGGASSGKLGAHQGKSEEDKNKEDDSAGMSGNDQMMQLIGVMGLAGGSTAAMAANKDTDGAAEGSDTDEDESADQFGMVCIQNLFTNISYYLFFSFS